MIESILTCSKIYILWQLYKISLVNPFDTKLNSPGGGKITSVIYSSSPKITKGFHDLYFQWFISETSGFYRLFFTIILNCYFTDNRFWWLRFALLVKIRWSVDCCFYRVGPADCWCAWRGLIFFVVNITLKYNKMCFIWLESILGSVALSNSVICSFTTLINP